MKNKQAGWSCCSSYLRVQEHHLYFPCANIYSLESIYLLPQWWEVQICTRAQSSSSKSHTSSWFGSSPRPGGLGSLSSASRGNSDTRVSQAQVPAKIQRQFTDERPEVLLKAVPFCRHCLHTEGLAGSWDNACGLPPPKLLGYLPPSQS